MLTLHFQTSPWDLETNSSVTLARGLLQGSLESLESCLKIDRVKYTLELSQQVDYVRIVGKTCGHRKFNVISTRTTLANRFLNKIDRGTHTLQPHG